MSLLFVGYETEKIDYSEWSGKPKDYHVINSGIFAIADSAITTLQGGKTLLTNFRKLYDIEVKVYEPSFTPDGTFRGYDNIYSRLPIIIGFAGNTLVAQHILNTISGHLEHLEISCKEREIGRRCPIEYNINMPCETNPLKRAALAQWDDDLFLPSDYDNLVTGELLGGFVEHSINHALESARRHRLNKEEFEQMFTDLFCGLYCPANDEYQVYVFRMKSKLEDGVLSVYTEKEKLPADEIAVLGMRKDFEEGARALNRNAVKNNLNPAEILEDYLSKCIVEVSARGSFEIDRPIVHKKLDRHGITKKHIM